MMGLFDGLFHLFDSEIDVKIQSEDQNKNLLNSSKKNVNRFNTKKLEKNYAGYDIKSAFDDFYYDDMPIPQKYVVNVLPEKRYDYAFNSSDGAYTIGITCFSKQSVAGYQLDVCEIVHIDNITNEVTVLENVMGVLDRERMRESHPEHKEYIDAVILKMFSEKRLDKIITQYKGHFGIVRYNKQKENFQLCSIKPVVEELNKLYLQAIDRQDIIPMDAININNKRKS